MRRLEEKFGVPFIAFEERPNSFVPVDLMNLDIIDKFENEIIYWNKKNKGIITLKVLDGLLSYYTKGEIIESIKRSNTIVLHDYNVPLIVRYNSRTFPLITKDNINEFNFIDIIREACENKNMATKFKNKYKNILEKYWGAIVSDEGILEQVELLLEALESRDESSILQIFNWLPYEAQREMMFYYYDNRVERKDAVRKKKFIEE